MKLRFLLPSVIFLFCGLVSQAQITEMLYLGFETGEASAYTGSYSITNQYHASGNGALQLNQVTDAEITLELNELDFTQNTALRYISLEFDHICTVTPNENPDFYMCRLYWKRTNESTWHQLTSSNYNMTNGGSNSFRTVSAFSNESYGDEWRTNTLSNDMWKSERFDINAAFNNVAPNERRLMIKFTMRPCTRANTTPGKWLIDNLKISASPSPMVKPTIKMVKYPDGIYHPSSRGAEIVIEPKTTISSGINHDSVYLFYRVGSDPAPIRLPMTQMTSDTNLYSAHIPFYGYDTTMYFYCVARDATSNANRVTSPTTENSWYEYRCIRGVAQPGLATEQFTGAYSHNLFPFGSNADGRSEWVFDSALLASAGYGPGQMTAMKMTFAAYTPTVTRQRMQIRMKNVPTNYQVDTSVADYYYYTSSYMHIVYDSAFTIGQSNAGGEQTIRFQDTFYYAGKDLVMQLVYDDDDDLSSATSIRMISAPNSKKSIYKYYGTEASMGIDAFNTTNLDYGDNCVNRRPALVMTQRANLPLLYDLGISELVSPSYETPMTQRPGSLTVKLKNFGALPVNAVRISYNIDDTIFGHYDWSGNLAGGADQNVTISNNIVIPAGFHTLKVWVEDTLTISGSQLMRDHEPYNDTSFSQFIVCDGAMSGVRHVGGATPDFNTIEEFLFALSRCGIGDSLVVKLAPGSYNPFTVPAFTGANANAYVVFEPEGNGRVTVFSSEANNRYEDENGAYLPISTSLVNLVDAANVRFRNINFVRYAMPLTDMVTMGLNSANCHFEGCSFIDSLANPAASMRINALINSGYANGLIVDGCTFVGGKTGVDVKGQASDIRSSSNSVMNSTFRNQYDYAVNASNQTNLNVYRNEMYDVLSNSMGVLLLNECNGTTRVTCNKIYTSHGGGGIALNSVSGNAAHHVLVANNMIVCNDDGTANLMRTPFNVITANYTDVVYNSVKMTATSRNNIAAVSFGGGTLQNSQFVNNVVVSLDNNNYALNYAPGSYATNTVGHNVYYSLGSILNRRSGAGCMDLDAWVMNEPADTNSIVTNPNFLNGSLVDLRTFNRLVKGVGIPIANVTTDMFDSVRSTTATCPGAFEFVSLAYDFEPEALISPVDETCYMPSSVELKVRLRNSGVNAYTGTGLQLKYKVDNATIQTVNVTGTVPAEDTVTIATGAMLALPSYATSDRTYNIKVWTVFASDPNQTNDTNDFQVVSKYRPAKPNNDSTSIAYATRATITPTSGVNSWAVYGSTSAPQRKSELYWFRDTTDAAPFHVGPTLTTDTLRMDSTFYFRQRRAKPIVRITQVEFNHANNAVGLTPSMPYWVNSGRKTAIQLTNVGDARANLFGDTIQTISPTQTLNNKVFVFTDSVFIEPGQSLVVQCATGNSANPALTIHTGTPLSSTTVSYTSKIAFVYRRGGVIEDAVALNAIGDASTQAITWANIGVPSYVWNGTGVNLASSNTAAGIIRNAFNGNASDWQIASAANPMFINTIRPTWIRYTDNGCEGYFASYKVKMIAPPAADIDLSTPILPATACGLGNENISVTVHNYGINSVSGLVLNYSDGNDTVTENVSQPIAANGVMTYTFAAPLNFAYSTDSLITVRVWADAVSGDNIHSNDTNYASVLSLYTPAAPDTTIVRTVSYANPDTITLPVVSGLVPVWYDYEGNAVDTGYTSISEILYVGGTRGVSYMATVPQTGIIGTGTSIPSNNTTPTPYQPATKYSRQQYIYSASELRAAGLEAGFINSVAFELMTIPGNNVNFVSFNDYTVSMGTTQDTIFSGNSDWKSTTQVSSQSPFVISQSDCNTWVSHPFSSPYYWDGTSSIVVEVSHYIATAVSTGAKSAYTPKTNAVLFKFNSNAITPTTAGGRHANRPNIRFSNTTYGCASAITPYTVQMVNIPSVDMAVLWPNGTDTIHYNSCSNTSFYVNVRNQGASEATSTTLYYYFDTLAVDSTVVTNAIASGATENVLLFNRHMNPGRHTLRVVVAANGDDISSNDTITRSFMVSFCSGTYTIATTGGDYRSFGEAIDTLNVVGIEGPVRFNVSPGIYTEQVVLNNIPGSSATNTIAFYGTGDDVLLTAAPTQNDNYVFLLDSTSNVTLSRFRIEARPPSGNYANALVLQKGGHITIDSLTVRVKGTVNNVNASAVVLLGEVSNLTFVNNTIDSGYYSFRTSGTLTNYQDFTLTNNTFRNFWLQGINVRGITNFVANNNRIRGGINGSNVTGRGLTGLYLAQSAGNISIQRNYIILIDDKNGGKRGIQLENINCGASNPALIANNMISCSGTGTAGLTPAKPSGIWIDSSSSYINVYFNTVRVYCGPYASAQFSDASYSFFSGATVSNIHVMNNIFSNFSKGYAYYVSELNTVNLSNYNDYYTVSARPFAWKSTNNTLADLVALQGINSDDANSVFQEPYFLSDEDLHLVMTNLAGIAQYNSDVPDDIDGLTRKQVPGPTIGAHEMDVVTHDMAVVRIVEPVMPASLNFNPPNNMPPHIESDSVRVIAQFYNNGMAPESNIQWYAYIEGFEAQTRTPNKNIGSFAPAESKMDTVMMPTVLGITDTNIVHVVVILPADSSLSDNDRVSNFYLAPAFNLAATRMSTDHTGCSMQNTVVKITVKNEGFKDVPAGTTFKIGYHPQITQPTTITSIYTMPDTVEQNTTLTTPLLMGQTQTIDFTAPANFYPTGESQDIKFRLMGWVNYSLDITQANDSTNKTSNSQSPVIDAYYSPEPPVGYDTVLPYGTWGEVRASQVNTRPIRWYRDSTATPYYHPTAYNASTKWSNTPQYFHDSVYYLNCLSTKNCPSFFSTVRVSVAPRLPNDMAFEAVLAPLGDRVYMENDTVRVRISNYGTSSQTNVPIAFQLKRGNNIIQNVTEVCPATIPAGQSYDYTFTTLLDIPTPTTAQNYTLTVWTDLATDGARRNDTIRTAYTFRSLAESLYNALASGNPSFDITRVSFNEIDYETPQQGRGYTNLGSYNDPDYPVLHVSRGLSDSIIVEVTPLDGNAQSARVSGWVYIDFNRNGTFEVSEAVVSEAIFYDREALRDVITIPATATPGYMRMRVAVGSYADFNGVPGGPVGGIPSDKNGHAIDFLLFVDPDAPQNDIAVTQIVGPRSYIIDDDTPREVSFRISNKGASPVSGPTFGYSFTGEEPDSTGTGVVSYPGTLAPGSSAVISLPGHSFPYGVTDLLVWSNQADDDNRSNDTLEYQYNRFYVITPPVMDSFDIDNKWYAPRGYNVYSHNYWELGTPAKQRINAPYSGDKAWVTDLTATSIVTGKRGNVSYLYSPIIDIHQIFPDTISVRIRRHLINGSSLRLEFRNFEGMWVNASRDSLFNWYNNQDGECFDGTSSGTTYNYYFAPTNYRDGMRGDFGDKVQFRFVYTTPIGSSATAAFGEGCAIDNFQLGRARRPVDAGIIDIVEPAAPAYGQTIFPKVVVHNYGTDTLREVAVGYIHYGTFLPKECTVSCLAAPGGNDTVLLTSPFVVTSDYPESFDITAFTMLDEDVYYDNDTIVKTFELAPLANDISAHSFIYPLEQSVAGDDLQVTIRMRNFGTSPISRAQATYIINGEHRVDEDVDFEALLGRPLASLEYFNYTFNAHFRAPYGVIKLTGIVKSDQNDYIYNDTITKRVTLVSDIRDIAAAAVIIDSSGFTSSRITLVIENRGGRGVNGFEVGFYIDGDTTQIYREVFNQDLPLAALGTAYHTFDVSLPQRSVPYSNVTGFVHLQGDNDSGNDTTNAFAERFLDLEMAQILIIENSAPTCQVIAYVVNRGNVPVMTGQVNIRATINGNSLNMNSGDRVAPGEGHPYYFERTIPKSPNHTYEGSAKLNYINDLDSTNDQSNYIVIYSYWDPESVPTVNGDELVLDQNYPNPFEGRTTVPFTLPNDANVRIFVIDAMGHVVNSFERFFSAGQQTVTLDLSAYSSGIYYYGIEVDGQRLMRKMILR